MLNWYHLLSKYTSTNNDINRFIKRNFKTKVLGTMVALILGINFSKTSRFLPYLLRLFHSGSSEGDESWIVVRRGHHWLHCVSHKSGIPLWVLTSILFLSSFFLLWLCCASTTSTPAAKKSARKVTNEGMNSIVHKDRCVSTETWMTS